MAFYVVPDFPTSRATWLTTEEQLLAQKRVAEDLRGVMDHSLESSKSSGLVEAFTDWTVLWIAIAVVLLEVSQSFLTFFPTIVATMGYSPSITLLLCTPPQILIVIVSFFVTRSVLCSVLAFCDSELFRSHSDMTRERFWHITGSISMSIIGFSIAASTMNNAFRYISL